jgi:hypothetical protein
MQEDTRYNSPEFSGFKKICYPSHHRCISTASSVSQLQRVLHKNSEAQISTPFATCGCIMASWKNWDGSAMKMLFVIFLVGIMFCGCSHVSNCRPMKGTGGVLSVCS